MYRKLALTSVTINVAFVFSTLFVFAPWFLNIAKDLKIEMPTPIIWLIELHAFLTSPQCIVPTLAILIVGFFGAKALRKRTTPGA